MTTNVTAIAASTPTTDWELLAGRAPQLAATMQRYLDQQAVTLSPATITVADRALRIFGLWVCDYDPKVVGVARLDCGAADVLHPVVEDRRRAFAVGVDHERFLGAGLHREFQRTGKA